MLSIFLEKNESGKKVLLTFYGKKYFKKSFEQFIEMKKLQEYLNENLFDSCLNNRRKKSPNIRKYLLISAYHSKK